MKKVYSLSFLCLIALLTASIENIKADNVQLSIKQGHQGRGTRSVVQIPVSADLNNNSSLVLSFLPPVTKATVNIEDVSTNAVVYSQDWNSLSDLMIDVNGYKSGTYYLEITIGGSVYEGEFIL